jgi:hypothetical protein
LRTRVSRFAERGVALDVSAVDDLAAFRSPAFAPGAEASVLANECPTVVRRARVILGRPQRATISLGSHGVVAFARRAPAFAPLSAFAEDFDPGTGKRAAALLPSGRNLLAHERAVVTRTEDLVGHRALLAGGWRRAARCTGHDEPRTA